MKKSDEELENYLKFELSPYPLSLFDDVDMRKLTKSVLYLSFQSIDIHFNKETSRYIIDGGMLLYRIKWPKNCNYEIILHEYTLYLKRNFGNNIVVVYDAYNGESTKIVERNHRSQKIVSK